MRIISVHINVVLNRRAAEDRVLTMNRLSEQAADPCSLIFQNV